MKHVLSLILIAFAGQSASAFFYKRPPVYNGQKIAHSTRSIQVLKDFVDDPKQYDYQNYLIHVYFNESQPGVPARSPEEAYSGFCLFDYVDGNVRKVSRGTYLVKRDLTMPAIFPQGLWYREIYFGWTRNIRVLCAGSKEKMMSNDYVNRLMKGYVRL